MPDVIQCHDPELFLHARLLSRLCNIKIFDSHENFIDQAESREWSSGIKKPLVNMIAKFIKRNILMYADGVIAATDAINATYSLSNKITVNNYPISDEMASWRGEVPLSK